MVGNTAGSGLLDQEVMLVDLNTERVFRVAHHRSYGKDGPNGYWAEPHVNISPSGSRILFGSDWGGGSSVDAYDPDAILSLEAFFANLPESMTTFSEFINQDLGKILLEDTYSIAFTVLIDA